MRGCWFGVRWVLGLGLLLPGCGDDDDGGGGPAGTTVSCRVESAGNALQCIEYRVPPDAVAATRQGCTAGGGTLVGACPTADRLGTCSTFTSSTVSVVTHYYSGGITMDSAMQICSASGGTWRPG